MPPDPKKYQRIRLLVHQKLSPVPKCAICATFSNTGRDYDGLPCPDQSGFRRGSQGLVTWLVSLVEKSKGNL